MKRIILVRHAKSSWEFDVSDRERPLKKRGVYDANLVVEAFNKLNFDVENVYSSPARRALDTCRIFLNSEKLRDKIPNIKEELYDFSGSQVNAFIKHLPQDENNVMIFGHNHAFTSISNIFGSTYIDNVPTSGLVVIKFETNSWNSIEKGTTELTIFPRDLK